jgi:hypothetical protein
MDMKDANEMRQAAIKNVEEQAKLWKAQMEARIEHYMRAHQNTLALLEASTTPQEIATALRIDGVASW